MAFWGIEVKAGKPFTHIFDEERGRLHISQATLGNGSSTARSVVQCNIGDKSPIILCALLPDKNESCPLDLEFEEENEVVFSVLGPRSVHLAGYYIGNAGGCGHDHDSDSYGEDIAESENDLSEFDSEEYDDDFIDDDDLEMFPSSPRQKSAVVIEEIEDDEKAATGNGSQKRPKKKNQISGSEGDAEKKVVVKGSEGGEVLESEDEDGFPVPSVTNKKGSTKSNEEGKSDKKAAKENKKKEEVVNHTAGKKRKIDTVVQDDEAEKSKVSEQPKDDSVPTTEVGKESDVKPKKKKKVGNRGDSEAASEVVKTDNLKSEPKEETPNKKSADHVAEGDQSEGKKKKKKAKKNKTQESDEKANDKVEENKSVVGTEDKKEKVKQSKVRTFANGLVIEDIKIGQPDGKRASPGNKVSVRYIGKLKSNGKVFDSNVGRSPPFKFRLGVGEVIKGWDVGVSGMRVGDKRRLTIPPPMGYGAKGAGPQIPPNAWLVFEVELIDVR